MTIDLHFRKRGAAVRPQHRAAIAGPENVGLAVDGEIVRADEFQVRRRPGQRLVIENQSLHARQRVGAIRADRLDAVAERRECVSRARACGRRAVSIPDRRSMYHRVGAALEQVVAGAAEQHIVAGKSAQRVP